MEFQQLGWIPRKEGNFRLKGSGDGGGRVGRPFGPHAARPTLPVAAMRTKGPGSLGKPPAGTALQALAGGQQEGHPRAGEREKVGAGEGDAPPRLVG